MTTNTAQRWIEREEAKLDLRRQLGSLDKDEEKEIEFQEWSPGRVLVTIWSLEDGEEVVLPRYQAVAAIGSGRWTTHPDQAPKRRVNNIKCFLHEDSPERPILDELGITRRCPAAHLANNGSKRTHAEHRHRDEWRQYQEYLFEQKEEANRLERREELAAFKDIAQRPVVIAAAAAAEPTATESAVTKSSKPA